MCFVKTIEIKNDWTIPLQVNQNNILFKLDTGTQVNVLAESEFTVLKPRTKLHQTNIKVTGYSGADIPVKGTCVAKVSHKNMVHMLSFVEVPRNVQSILGLSACERLNLVKRVLVLDSDTESEYSDLMKEYEDLFKGLGCLPGEHMIKIDNTVPLVVHPCRKVLFALCDQLKTELDRMEQLEVIKKAPGPIPLLLASDKALSPKPGVAVLPSGSNTHALMGHAFHRNLTSAGGQRPNLPVQYNTDLKSKSDKNQNPIEEVKAQVKELRSFIEMMKSQHKKEITQLMNELDEEKKIRISLQMEVEGIKKATVLEEVQPRSYMV
ncbi:uncharacterized protein [Hemitrygon akajei]|uniref:uncharacterized protein n=1 Tax=Hemitrygon akajei TaxID=2704970 RepID=UPI003BF9B35F